MSISSLIGVPYKYGDTDCIWMVLTVLDELGIEAPRMDRTWYEMTPRQWARDLLKWGRRIKTPSYDGDVLVQPNPVGFSVVWQNGVLYFHPQLNAVHWSPVESLIPHCCRTSDNLYRLSAFRKKNIV